jgi:hypothetical protein
MNVVGAATGVLAPGQGLEGLRRRLDSVGGRMDVRRSEDAEAGATFTTIAWIPVRTGPG